MEYSNIKAEPKTDNGDSKGPRLSDLENVNTLFRQPLEETWTSGQNAKPRVSKPLAERGKPREYHNSTGNDNVTIKCEIQIDNDVEENIYRVKTETRNNQNFLDTFMHIDHTFESIDKFISSKLSDDTGLIQVNQSRRNDRQNRKAVGKTVEKCTADVAIVRGQRENRQDAAPLIVESDAGLGDMEIVSAPRKTEAVDNVLSESESSVPDLPKLEIDIDVADIGYSYALNNEESCGELPNTTGRKRVTVNPTDNQRNVGSAAFTDDRLAEYKLILGYPESKLQCPVCLKKFQTKKFMRLHKDEEHGDKIYHCDQCDRWFSTSRRFDDHLRLHLNIRPYKCNTCSKGFTAHKYLLHHAKNHTEVSEKKYSCSYCTKRFIRQKHLESHERMHTNERPYKCSDCDKAYKYEPQLRIHRRLHTGQRFYCDRCHKPFIDKGDMERHKISVHSDLRAYKCDTCGASFKHKGTLNTHARVHADLSQLETKECGICGQVFKCKDYLKKHMEVHEQNRPSFTCDLCGTVFVRKSGLNSHIKNTCKSLEYPEWRCDICGQYLKTKGNLHKHRKRHTDGCKYPCKKCDRSFPFLNLLERHVRHDHLKVEKRGKCCKLCRSTIMDMELHLAKRHSQHVHKEMYQCSTCGQAFKHKNNLRHHENTHLDVKPYRCDTCQRTFAQKGQLNTHIRTVHVNLSKPQKPVVTEKGTKCKICWQVKRNIKKHMKYHEMQSPIECSICKKRFTTKSHLNTHAAIHMEVKPWRCDVCQYTFAQKEVLKCHIIRKHIPAPKAKT